MVLKVLILGILATACLARPENSEGTVATGDSCDSTTTGGGEGRCVPFYLCKEEQVTTGIIDIRGLKSPCTSYLDVCCEKDRIMKKEE